MKYLVDVVFKIELPETLNETDKIEVQKQVTDQWTSMGLKVVSVKVSDCKTD